MTGHRIVRSIRVEATTSAMADLKPQMTAEDLVEFMDREFPQSKRHTRAITIADISPGEVSIRFQADESHLRPGGTISGPTLFWLADLGGYICVLSHIGPEALAVTTNLNINFMRKAGPGMIDAKARILKLGKRLMVFDIEMKTAESGDIIAHATGTYAIPQSV